MTAPVFVDTNVLVYARDATEPDKCDRAREWIRALWETRLGRLSFQILSEYYVTVTRKLTPGMSQADARADVRNLLAWQPLRLDPVLFEAAFAIEDRYGFSYWDSLVVAAAERAGCGTLLTEDLQDGQAIGRVEVVDPFRHSPSEVLGG